MKKRAWIDPVIHYNPGLGGGGDDTWQAPGSGQSTPDPDASWTYEEWQGVYEDFPNILDYDGNGTPGTLDDYVAWYRAIFHTDPPVMP